MELFTWNFNKNFIFVIVYWVLEIAVIILLDQLGEKFTMTNDMVIDEYISVILINIADLLAIFLILYSKCATKSNKIETKGTKIQSDLIYKKFDKLKKIFYIKLIVVAILDYISHSSYWISYSITRARAGNFSTTLPKNIKIALDIIVRYILSVFILKIVVYKHRIFSMITIGIGLAIFIINDILLIIFGSNYELSKTFIFAAIASISGFTYPIEDTLIKQIFSEEYLFPANFQFYRGITELILIAVITPILFFSFKLKLVFVGNVSIMIPALIINALADFIKSFITFKIIYHYSSQSVSFLRISQSFGSSITKFIGIFGNNNNKNNIDRGWKIILIILEFISVIIILFASLVYDEIVIINKWGLNKNVKLGIIYRGVLDTKDTFRERELEDNPLVDNDSNEDLSEDNNNRN